MQVKHLLISAFAFISIFASCKKNNDDIKPTGTTLEGKWVGKYSILSDPYNGQYSFNIKAGGVLERLDAGSQVIGTGTWEIEQGNLFSGTYISVAPASDTFSVIATFDKEAATLDGTWGPGEQMYGGGYWYMEKTN